MPFLRGIICKLAERLCALIILCPSAVPLLAASSAALSLAPIDIIETERLCVLPDAEAFECPAVHDPGPGGDRPMPTGALNESAGRWPLAPSEEAIRRWWMQQGSRWRGCRSNILEGYLALNLLARKYCLLGPLYKDPDVGRWRRHVVDWAPRAPPG
jgi:hypothetical protein